MFEDVIWSLCLGCFDKHGISLDQRTRVLKIICILVITLIFVVYLEYSLLLAFLTTYSGGCFW